MENISLSTLAQAAVYKRETQERSDRLMNYFLPAFFIGGLLFAPVYGTWLIALTVGSCNLLAYYFTKAILPASNLYQYILSLVLGVFMAQYIYQMHGLFEMHFFAFIGSAI
ncbi:MAG: sensor histidine kinase, partial [Aquabacterium sp.]|nr:sensor histidine kinase [Ferruginibacter sp.]